jgi:hypothetical protein
MKLNRKQSIYGGVMIVAAVAFAWDRIRSGPTTPATAEASAQPAADPLIRQKPTAIPKAPRGSGPTATTVAAKAVPLAERLFAVARANNLDSSHADNAFALQRGWIKEKLPDTVQGQTHPDPTEADRKLVEAFRKHHLDAVMVGKRGGYAIIDGQTVLIGQTYHKFKLQAVTQTTATFTSGELEVELKLSVSQGVKRAGGVIENAKTGVDDDGAQ